MDLRGNVQAAPDISQQSVRSDGAGPSVDTAPAPAAGSQYEAPVRGVIDELRKGSAPDDPVQKDLNPDAWPAGEKPWQNPVVQALFVDGMYDEGPSIPEGENVDDHMDYSAHYSVLDTDSTQQRVIEDARLGKSLVVEGPPGSGKSTTITNVVANAVAAGKKVLVVSEKTAALQVVQKWLSKAGLEDICLPLYGEGAAADRVLKETGRTLELGSPIEIPRDAMAERLLHSQTHLNGVCRALAGEVGKSGFSAYKVLSEMLIMQKKRAEILDLDVPEMRTWSRKDFDAATEFVTSLERYYSSSGIPRSHPFYGIGVVPGTGEELQNALSAAAEAGQSVERAADRVYGALGLKKDVTEQEAVRTNEILELIADAWSGDGSFFSDVNFEDGAFQQEAQSIQEMLAGAETFFRISRSLKSIIKPAAWKVPNLAKLRDLLQANAECEVNGRKPDQHASDCRGLMEELCIEGQCPRRFGEMLRLMDKILELKRSYSVLQDRQGKLRELFGDRWVPGEDKDALFWRQLEFTVGFTNRFISAAKSHPEFAKLVALCREPSALYELDDAGAVEELHNSLEKFREARKALLDTLQFSPQVARERILNQTIQEQARIFDGWKLHADRINDLQEYSTLLARYSFPGKDRILELAEGSPLPPGKLAEAMRFAWFSTLAEDFLTYGPLAGEFKSAIHENYIEEFRASDFQLLRQNSAAIARRHWQGIPRLPSAGQNRVLADALKAEDPSLSLRTLLTGAGRAVQAVKPVFLMNPASVAENLQPGSLDFDLVLFDEGSQISMLNALGSILRGKQVIVFGDRRQLSTPADKEGSADAGTGSAGIMDYCIQAGMPRRELGWHYRSRKEGLVRISNQEFYEGTLSTFPCAQRGHASLGLDFVLSKPQTEAEEIAQAVLTHAKNLPDESLGVITANPELAGAIREAVARLAEQHEELRRFLNAGSHDGFLEPFFVKTIMEVQGDERERIIVSFGTGSLEKSRPQDLFEPFEKEGGLNCLNVLMTRARSQCTIFSSSSPEDLAQYSSSEAARILRDYFRYARDGQTEETDELSTKAADAFHSIIAGGLEAHGYKVEANVGNSDIKVDLAVIDPRDPSRFVLGILSDGEHYQALQSARERERLVPDALRQRGWNLHRVWIIDWYRNPEEELQRLLDHLEELCFEPPAPPAASETFLEREVKRQPPLLHQHEALSDYVPYETAKIKRSDYLTEADPETVPISAIKDVLRKVVQCESPVHREEAQRRVLGSLGLIPRAAEFQETLAAAELDLRKECAVQEESEGFLACNDGRKSLIRDRSNCLGSLRTVTKVSPSEIDEALVFLARNTGGISRSDMPNACVELLGLLPSPADQTVFDARIKVLVEEEALRDERGVVMAGCGRRLIVH